MSGEWGLAGYRFQYHVTVLTALELWGGDDDSQVHSILVEGRPGADKVDYERVGHGPKQNTVVQVKSRWGAATWSPRQIVDLLLNLDDDAAGSARLELVANGAFSAPALRLVDLLRTASTQDDRALTEALRDLMTTLSPTPAMLAALRRSSVTIRTEGLPELADQVRTGLRRLRARSGQGVGDQAAELLRAHLLNLAMEKTTASDVAGRALTRMEFRAAVGAERRVLESALTSRWGVPGRLTHREHAVHRDGLLAKIGSHLTAPDGTHATDGRVRSCVLAGPAGIGKTTLAHQYALDNAGEFDWIYQLTAQGDDEASGGDDALGEQLEQFATWLDHRGLPVRRHTEQSAMDIRDAVVDTLSACTQSWLLIIDNAATADTVSALIPPSGYGTVLITTRNSGWNPERPMVKVGALSADQARTLVSHRLGHDEVDTQEVDALCQRLEYLPLSLVTATSYVHSTQVSIRTFLDMLADEVHRLDALDFSLQQAGDYPRTAVAAVHLALTSLTARDEAVTADAITLLRRASLVFPDRIPAHLVMPDRKRLDRSIAVLGQFSLIERWHDEDDRDWLRIHRIIQDVVRANLDRDPQLSARLLREVELAATDLLAECGQSLDLVVGGALRLHAITLAERLRVRGLDSWETTTALLANAGSIAHAQGDLREAERLLERALSLIPAGNYDPQIAGRRGKTLVTLAHLQLERHADQAATACLIQARDAHNLHRHIRAHAEALVECIATLSRLDAFAAEDPTVMREQFDKVHALPVETRRAAMIRAACLVNLARDMSWDDGNGQEFRECAEHLLDLVSSDDCPEPRAAVHAHLHMAEVHGAEGGFDAAWQHYRAAQDLIDRIPGIDPTFGPDEGLEVVLGLLSALVDKTTGYPYRDVDRLIRQLLAATELQVSRIQWGEGQRDWLPIRLAVAKATHAAHNGAVERCTYHAREARRLAESHPGPLPDKVIAMAVGVAELADATPTRDSRRHGLPAEQDLSRSPAAPLRPRVQPTPCRHFDAIHRQLAPAPQPAPQQNDQPSRPLCTIDRLRSSTLHGHTVVSLLAHGDPADHAIGARFRPLQDDPQSLVDHLIGAWRIIDTLCHRISRITDQPVDDLRQRNDETLIRSQHDTGADTVPTRLALRCLNNDWWPELDELVRQFDLDSYVRMMEDLVHLEYRLAAEVGRLVGHDLDRVITSIVDIAIAYDSTRIYQGENTYDQATGRITIGRDILGEPQTLQLHPTDGPGVHTIWILGAEDAGKSALHRLVTFQAAVSGVFHILPADPRNEHDFPRLWERLVPVPACIATNVSGTLDNMELLTRIIEDRTSEAGHRWFIRDHPAALLTVDDADDVLAVPRGRALFERIVAQGPAVCVGVLAVIRDLACLEGSEHLLAALANSTSVVCFGREELAALEQIRDTYRNHGQS